MKTLNKPGDNLGGILKLWAIPYGTFSTQGATINFINQDNIWQIYCSPESIDFSENSELSASGLIYNTELRGFIPQDNASLQTALAYLDPRKWAVIFIDGNGKYKLAGNQNDPLRFSSELNTGKETASLAGCSFKFYGKTKYRSVFINNPF